MAIPIAAVATVGKSTFNLFKSLSKAFGGKLVYGLEEEGFAQRWTSAYYFRHQWLWLPETGGKSTFWFDSNEAEGKGVAEVKQVLPANWTMGDFYVNLTSLQAYHEVISDTVSGAAKGYPRDKVLAEQKVRQAHLSYFLSDYVKEFGSQAHSTALNGKSYEEIKTIAQKPEPVVQASIVSSKLPLILIGGGLLTAGYFAMKGK